MTKTSNENVVLNQILYFYYPLWFKKNEVQALINSGSKINIKTLVYVLKLDLQVRYTNVKAQKIDGSTLKTFDQVLASF